MSDIEKVMPMLRDLGRAFAKFARIERMPFDFGMEGELYPAEVHLVATISRLGSAGVTEIARETGVTKGAVSQLAAKLVKKGFLEKRPDPENGARVIISATDRGQVLAGKHDQFHLEHDREFLAFLAGLNPDEREVAARLCARMDQWMDRYLT